MLSRLSHFQLTGGCHKSDICNARSVEYDHFNTDDTDADCTIRWLIALMVMCCDPLLSH
jgi:hypothetical protein